MSPSSPVRRRTVLASSVSLFTGLAGCSIIFDQSSEPETYHPPPLHAIRLWNYYDEPKHATLVVERDGHIVHWNTYKVPMQADTSENDLDVLSISNKEWMGCGRYEVSTRLQNKSQWATLDFRDVEPSGMANGKIQTIRLGIDFNPEGIDFRPVHLDDPMVRCEDTQTGTQATQE